MKLKLSRSYMLSLLFTAYAAPLGSRPFIAAYFFAHFSIQSAVWPHSVFAQNHEQDIKNKERPPTDHTLSEQASSAQCGPIHTVAPTPALSTEARVREESSREVIVTPVWNQPARLRLKYIESMNGVMVSIVSAFFFKKNRFPTESEIIAELKKVVRASSPEDLVRVNRGEPLINRRGQIIQNYGALVAHHGLKAYWRIPGAPSNLLHLFRISVRSRPESFAAFKVKKILKPMAQTFMKQLRWMSFAELSETTGLPPEHLKVLLGQSRESKKEFEKFLHERTQKEQLHVKDKLARAFLAHMRQTDRSRATRTVSTTPTLAELLTALSRPPSPSELRAEVESGRLGLDDLQEFFGIPRANADVARPTIFPGGITELETYARNQNPAPFENHLSQWIQNLQPPEKMVEAIKKCRGILVANFDTRMPIEKAQLELMKRFADQRDFIIILYPAAGILDVLDQANQDLILEILSDDRIFILTHTLTTENLRLWNIPISPKMVDPLTSLERQQRSRAGRLTVVGAPQTRLLLSPRVDPEESGPTIFASPGSINENAYPYRQPIQGRQSKLAEGRHQNGFMIIEKSTISAGPLGMGVQDGWLPPRNVEITLSGPPHQKVASFNDLHHHYVLIGDQFRVLEGKAQALALGDFHDAVTLQALLPHLQKFIHSNPGIKYVILHDPLDGASHNRHERDQLLLLRQKFARGELDLLREYLGLVQSVNALLNMRSDLRVVMVDSNHSHWGAQLINDPSPLHQVINGELIAEIRQAMQRQVNPIRNPLEYFFDPQGRELYLRLQEAALSTAEFSRIPGSQVRLNDPNRVRVLPAGAVLTLGGANRPVQLHLHGHQGANGAKGSVRAHSTYGGNSVSGDSHQPNLTLEFMNVGTTTRLRLGYNEGGYSSWGVAFGIIFEDGTKQLVIFDPRTQQIYQDPEEPVLSEELFFPNGIDIEPNSNDRFPGRSTIDQYGS